MAVNGRALLLGDGNEVRRGTENGSSQTKDAGDRPIARNWSKMPRPEMFRVLSIGHEAHHDRMAGQVTKPLLRVSQQHCR